MGLSLIAACGGDGTGPDDLEYVLGDLICCEGQTAEAFLEPGRDSLTIHVTTWGSSCEAKGALWIDVNRDSLRLTISPMDLRPVESAGPSTCVPASQRFEHAATIGLERGTWGITIRGVDASQAEEPLVTLTGRANIPPPLF